MLLQLQAHLARVTALKWLILKFGIAAGIKLGGKQFPVSPGID
jgi:hypothetical protein